MSETVLRQPPEPLQDDPLNGISNIALEVSHNLPIFSSEAVGNTDPNMYLNETFSEFFDDTSNLEERDIPIASRGATVLPSYSQSLNTMTWEYDTNLHPANALAVIYGDKPEVRVQDGEQKVVGMKTLKLDALTRLHEKLQRDVLIDEHGMVPKVVTPPAPEKPLSPVNNDCWLENIKNHIWPMMVGLEAGVMKVSKHDSSTDHIAVTSLFPRTQQDGLALVAERELERRKQHPKGLSEPIIPDFPNKDDSGHETDPWTNSSRGFSGYLDGIDIIDQSTGTDAYLNVLSTLFVLPKHQFDTLASTVMSNEKLDEEYASLMSTLSSAARGATMIANYHKRYEENRDMTPEEGAAVIKDFNEGAFRVAQKLRGEWHQVAQAAAA